MRIIIHQLVRTLYKNATGHDNVAVGTNALTSNEAGDSNVAVGVNALNLIETGYQNTAVGIYALSGTNTNSVVNAVTAIGYKSAVNYPGNNNTFLGAATDSDSHLWQYSTAVGYGAQITASNQLMLGKPSWNVDTTTIPATTVVVPGTAKITFANITLAAFDTAITQQIKDFTKRSIVPKSYVDSVASGIKPV